MPLYLYHKNTQFCAKTSTDCSRFRSSTISPPSAFSNNRWGRDEAAGRHRPPLPQRARYDPTSDVQGSRKKLQEKKALPTLQLTRSMPLTDKPRKSSLTKSYMPPPAAEVSKYARRSLPALPIFRPNSGITGKSCVSTNKIANQRNPLIQHTTPAAPPQAPSRSKSLLATVGDRSFAARAANDGRFVKAKWGIDVRRTGRRDSLTGKVEVEVHGLGD